MRKNMIGLAAAATLFGAAFACQAMPYGTDAPLPPERGASDRHDLLPLPEHLARTLDLSDVQQKRIRSILDEQRGKGWAQMDKEFQLREQLHSLEVDAEFNEQAVRGVATALGTLEAERLVARAKTQARINAVLTPQQRALAEKLHPRKGELPPPPPCGCGPEQRGDHGPATFQDGR
ncbi:Spy/CpxP family protein refolding chaperone [Geomonas nitrogeniifigens]|uniref:Spy/CpxP family protein refolding chaperone n=1 Tax=Geomonas diazotrophica TaxID=2843197 RepID=A0ABX8JEM1_9BACT|nr:Spy/CpxP family protein refolding chaperone [Geomonas nitrogeniifigens]QWV96844.1 Spy/CpxP family protein refolding chaperone [Geomonas nitrogeniifigens]QXE85946.1 Spy/CpxP family protein refolding chaperone [Geomonas nitrogeniifigens]